MSANATAVRCGDCGRMIPEPPDLPLDARRPCPDCGSKRRAFEVSVSSVIRVSASASATLVETTTLKVEDAGYDVQWSQLSPGGAWWVRVYDRDGNLTDSSIADDPQDAVIAVAERLLP